MNGVTEQGHRGPGWVLPNAEDLLGDYDNDKVTLTYDPKKTSPEKLSDIIKALGYKTEVVQATEKKAEASALKPAPVPDEAPTFFREAMGRAKKSGRPVIIDF